MEAHIDPYLPKSDLLVLHNLLNDIDQTQNADQVPAAVSDDYSDAKTETKLAELKTEPAVFCSWDYTDLPLAKGPIGGLLQAYISWAQTVVRHPVDVIFLTHILLYSCTSVPSAIYLYHNFSWLHGVLHLLMQGYYCGSFTLLLHNCIHQNGLLSRPWVVVDTIWPYVLSPLMGHTWNSYYYHHVKHHHVENNGPGDLSSTLRYQRDELSHFLMYVGRFLAFIWIELPMYFARKQNYKLALKSAGWEYASYSMVYLLARLNWRPTLFVLILPLILMRIGLMVGNYGQHALVDEIDPKSDFRSSITLIDVPSNRFCFNDGWHTSHHLNPLRHWRDHPAAFMKAKKDYQSGKALFFRNIDYIMMTYRLLKKDYLYLADCMIPIGDQIGLTREQRADLLRTKTRRFTEAEIQEKYFKTKAK